MALIYTIRVINTMKKTTGAKSELLKKKQIKILKEFLVNNIDSDIFKHDLNGTLLKMLSHYYLRSEIIIIFDPLQPAKLDEIKKYYINKVKNFLLNGTYEYSNEI